MPARIASIKVRYSFSVTGTRAWRSSRKKPVNIAAAARSGSAALAPREEGQALEQMHVLLVLEECAVERRDHGLGVLGPDRVRRQILDEQQLQPVQELGRARLLLQAGHLAQLEERRQ